VTWFRDAAMALGCARRFRFIWKSTVLESGYAVKLGIFVNEGRASIEGLRCGDYPHYLRVGFTAKFSSAGNGKDREAAKPRRSDQ